MGAMATNKKRAPVGKQLRPWPSRVVLNEGGTSIALAAVAGNGDRKSTAIDSHRTGADGLGGVSAVPIMGASRKPTDHWTAWGAAVWQGCPRAVFGDCLPSQEASNQE
jgi:hypothetical protein